MMTKQEVFDAVARHLLTQRRRSFDGKAGCAYRGPEGRKCAAGALLPDDQYDPRMEGHTVFTVTRGTRDKFAAIVGESNLGLLGDLQSIHDTGLYWSIKLKECAEKHCVSSAVVEEYPSCLADQV